MAIVQAGKQFTAPDVKVLAGNVVSHVRDFLQQGEQFRLQLTTFGDADLVALGLSQPEIDAIKGFFTGAGAGDLVDLRNRFLASAWAPKLLGLGV